MIRESCLENGQQRKTGCERIGRTGWYRQRCQVTPEAWRGGWPWWKTIAAVGYVILETSVSQGQHWRYLVQGKTSLLGGFCWSHWERVLGKLQDTGLVMGPSLPCTAQWGTLPHWKKGRETIQEDQSREKIFTLHILAYIVENDFIQEMQYFSVRSFYCWQNRGRWIVCSYLSEQMSWRSLRNLASICHFLYFKEKSMMGGLSPLIPGDKAQVFMFQCFVLRIVCLDEFKTFLLGVIF